MEKRTKHTYGTAIYEFARTILVVCPSCGGQALVRLIDPESKIFEAREVKVVCAGCGFNKSLGGISFRNDPKQKRGNLLIFGAPVDPFFHLPVWLQADFSGETLWAYNLEHLDFLAAHVGAKLRERNQANAPRSIGSRLPRWMTSAGNREAVLKLIEKLKEKQVEHS